MGQHRASIVYAVRALTDPGLQANDGVLRAVTIVCPRGNVLNPHPPAAVSVRHNTCQRLADTLIRAASAIWPGKAVGSSTVAFFGMNLDSLSPRTGVPSVMAEVMGGGTGAHRAGDGLDGVDTYMANVGLMPVEVAETAYSVRVLRTELIPGSQGTGQFNGGLGLRREYQVLERASVVTMYSEQTNPRFAPRGAMGGTDGSPSAITVLDPGGREIPVASKTTMLLEPGAVIRIETSGGGGFGDPALRDPDLAAADRVNGRIQLT